MGSVRRNLIRFLRAFRKGEKRRGRHRGNAIARTFRDGTTVYQGRFPGRSRSEALMAEAAERYDASFED